MKASIYSGAWKRLKQFPNEPLIIAAHKALHRRIYKAIIKQKHEDSIWQYEMSEAELRGTLSRVSIGDQLVVRIQISKHVPIERMF